MKRTPFIDKEDRTGKTLESSIIARLYIEEPESARGFSLSPELESEDGVTPLVGLRNGQNFRIGRSKSNDFAISDKNVSRFHAVLSVSSTGVLLSDLSSLNGTSLNGVRISSPVNVSTDDVVTVGDYSFRVVLGSQGHGAEESLLGCTLSTELVSVRVTVLVVDVCGFTRMSEALPPNDVATMLNRWLDGISTLVRKYEGEVDKFIGDCVMAVWKGGPESSVEFARKAVLAGKEMIRVTDEMAADGQWSFQEKHPWRCRVALNSGEALLGTLGGAQKRDFTVLGDSVNLVFRLEDVASDLGTNFILSEATALLVQDEVPLRELKTISVAGRSEPVTVFTLGTARGADTLSEEEEKASRLVLELKEMPVIAEILGKLQTDLGDDLHYHTLSHTYDVFNEVVVFALFDDLTQREIELLAIAAAYHDAGFLKQREDNERIGARMADEAMRRHGGFSEEECSLVYTMIIDTTLIRDSSGVAQRAQTPLSKYLLDADLSNFGRADFFERMEAHRQEVAQEAEEEYRVTLEIMESHQWYTSAAKSLRQGKKQENLKKLREMLRREKNKS